MTLLVENICSEKGLEFLLDLIVEGKHESTTGTSDDVRKATFEKSICSLSLVDLLHAINSTVVKLLFASRSHHKSSSDGIQWV